MIKKTSKLTISKLAELAGLNVQSIRYYESLGLLPEPERTESQYRQYSENYLQHIAFIKNAQELGFTLEEIKDLVDLRFDCKAIGRDVKQLVREKIQKINCEIDTLKNQKTFLEKLDSSCSGEMSSADCPILNTLKTQQPKTCCH